MKAISSSEMMQILQSPLREAVREQIRGVSLEMLRAFF
jgi:hypothetical protein